MARIRNIKPDFFKNEDLAILSAYARLCFIGLWTLADRRGILEDRPKRIQAELFPYEPVDIEALLGDLERAGFITRYTAGSIRAICIPTFVKHQYVNVKEHPNEIPEPDEHSAETVPAPDEHQTSTPLNGQLTTDNRQHTPAERAGVGEYPAEFEARWQRYPKNGGRKKDAYAAWKRLTVKQQVEADDGLDRWLPYFATKPPDKVPHMSTWINGRQWEVDPPLTKPFHTEEETYAPQY